MPLALFPGWLQTVSKFLPFSYLYSFPINLLLGNVSSTEIVTNITIMCGWLLGWMGVFGLLFRRAVNAFVVQGG